MIKIDSFIFSELKEKFNGNKNLVRQLNPLILASVGDAVYSLNIRAHLVATHDMNANSLHGAASKLVCAVAQKNAYFLIEDMLTEDELYIAKRGRNSHPGTVPKNADIIDYRVATAFEAVLGYLYISGENGRIDEIIKKILENNK